jgi:hypothetical protein
MSIGHSSGELNMFKDLIKFTAKVAIFAIVVKFVILPNIPGMPNLGDYLPKLPSWQQTANTILNPPRAIFHSQSDKIDQETPHVKIFNQNIPVIPNPLNPLPNF